jgi:hypothetical protein
LPTHADSAGRGRSSRPLRDSDVMHGLRAKSLSRHPRNQGAIIQGWIRAWRTDGLGPFIETAATNGQVVGQAGLMIFEIRGWTTWANAGSHGQPELGWALIRAQWGHGYATEAAAATIDRHSFAEVAPRPQPRSRTRLPGSSASAGRMSSSLRERVRSHFERNDPARVEP